ncbi:hypothetical protein Tco_0386209 [Tanacetum coccineum]
MLLGHYGNKYRQPLELSKCFKTSGPVDTISSTPHNACPNKLMILEANDSDCNDNIVINNQEWHEMSYLNTTNTLWNYPKNKEHE